MNAQPPAPKTRFVFIDGLRGIAALSVVLFHVYAKNLLPMTGYEFPEPLHWLFSEGHLGVYVFFVISGFVIAQSIQGESITPRFAGWFALRRSIRLDLPYWATIVGMIVLTLISNRMQHERSLPVPSAGAVLSHLVYLQGFLGYPNIVGVFWTLCYEVQFYLTLILIVGGAQLLARRTSSPSWLRSPLVLFLPLWLVSLVIATGRIDVTEALFLYGWPFFALGVAINWVHNRQLRPMVLVLLGATIVAAGMLVEHNPHFELLEIGAALVTAAAIYWVSRTGRLASLTLGRATQYLGRISYSLYLVHMLVGTPSMRFGIRLLGKAPSFLEAIILVILSTGVSIVAAHLMYVLVERPATNLSRRLRPRPLSPANV